MSSHIKNPTESLVTLTLSLVTQLNNIAVLSLMIMIKALFRKGTDKCRLSSLALPLVIFDACPSKCLACPSSQDFLYCVQCGLDIA
ncbi:hypothetical protein CEXT_152361 [Caerostris extrusa]|uniref:Uncharacterized protein n=1 Tax=Caerostris extrusa TaxID=172846 RepID=A0AAV4WPR9_CAEEX|nr:hypothetical protein CEXT_152361 [Caerostris extrusa]